MMPKMDGNELTGKLKSDLITSHIPVIILTAKVTMESKLEGLETGADDFLTKPFDAQELLIRIRNLITQRQKLRTLLWKHLEDNDQTKAIWECPGSGWTTLDEHFIEGAISVVEAQITNPDFNVEIFAREMAMSRKHLHRKLTGLIDQSPNNLIRNIRLKRAAELLKQGKLNVTQVTYEVGITSLSYFAKAFKEKYGVSPSDYA
jgi:DNA-binding response OmpR family regulator